jgi:hypothetical protein
VLAVDGDVIAVVDAGIHHDAVSGREAGTALHDPGAVGAKDPGLRGGRPAASHPEVDVVEGGCAKPDQDVIGPGHRIGRVFVAKHLGPTVLVDSDRLHETDLSM